MKCGKPIRLAQSEPGTAPSDDDRATPVLQNGGNDNPGTTTLNEQQWRTDTIRQALAETCDSSTLSSKCRDLHARLVSILTNIIDDHELITQTLIDDVYAQVVAQIEPSQTKRDKQLKRTKRPTTQAGCKRKQRTYKGIPWLEDEDRGSPKPDDVQSF